MLYPPDSCSNHFETLFVRGTDVTTGVTFFSFFSLVRNCLKSSAADVVWACNGYVDQCQKDPFDPRPGVTLQLYCGVVTCDLVHFDSGLSAGDNCDYL